MANITINDYIDFNNPTYGIYTMDDDQPLLMCAFKAEIDYDSSNTYTISSTTISLSGYGGFNRSAGSHSDSVTSIYTNNDSVFKFSEYTGFNNAIKFSGLGLSYSGSIVSSNYNSSGAIMVVMVIFNNSTKFVFGLTSLSQGTSTSPIAPLKIASSGQKGSINGVYNDVTISIGATLTYSNLFDGDFFEIDAENPYEGGDKSVNPGNGTFDYTGDEIGIPDLPTVSVTDSGFVRLFNPSTTQLQSLVSFMWSDEFSIDTFKKMLNNPMECILGLSIIPVNVPVATAQEITVGNIISTVSANIVTSQFVSVDCGTLEISPTLFTGSYLDYAPYIKSYLYLPFIGVQEINIDDVMNSTLHVVYHVDLLTGACVCYVHATVRVTGGVNQPDAVLYTYMGQCAESIPLSSSDFTGAMNSILNAAASIGGAVASVATGGMSALTGTALSGVASSVASATASQKPSISHSGSMGGSSGFMNIRYPYMIFDCPHTSIPQKQRLYTGYPSNKIVEIGNLSGFNVIQAINLTVQHANDSELEEIQKILESGVII